MLRVGLAPCLIMFQATLQRDFGFPLKTNRIGSGCSNQAQPSPQLGALSHPFFGWEGSPTKIDVLHQQNHRNMAKAYLGPPVVPFYSFLGEGPPTKIDYRRVIGYQPILNSLITGGPRATHAEALTYHSYCDAMLGGEGEARRQRCQTNATK